jgi:hypothetical protein
MASSSQKDASEPSHGIGLSSSKVAKKPPRGDRYRAAWPSTSGLRVAQRHPRSGEVMSLSCLFCSHFGQETAQPGQAGASRKPLATVNHFETPWRAANFTQHLKRQLYCKWAEYQSHRESNKLSDSDPPKIEFFTMGSRVPFANTMKSHADIGGILYFWIDEKIVTNIVGALLFGPATTDERHDVAIGIFEQPEEDSEESGIGAFRVTIGRTLDFELITSHVAAGLSFRQARNVLRKTHQRTGLNKLSGVPESDVAKYIHAVVAFNLRKMSSLLQFKECWAFSIAFDCATKHGISFIDADCGCTLKVRFKISICLPFPYTKGTLEQLSRSSCLESSRRFVRKIGKRN